MKTKLSTDYLVVGAGAMGLAFADEIIHGSKDRHVVLIDRRAKPGGHWNDAYSFVRLHQSALIYGVNSEPLGSGDARDLASKAEILSYDEKVIKKLTATGRFTFLPQCEYVDGRVVSMVAPETEYDIEVRLKTVDASYMNVTVPSTSKPGYEVEDGVELVPINGLADCVRPAQNYCVIGAGKTGMDAVLHLLDQKVDPDRIRWIMPNDAWLQTRECTMPDGFIDFSTSQVRSLSSANSVHELFMMQEEDGIMMRLDPDSKPTRFRCATVSRGELVLLRSIKDVVRKGRVKRIGQRVIHLTEGETETLPDTLYVDCAANGLVRRDKHPIFEPGRMTLQPVFMCQQVASAAMLAALELRLDEEKKYDCVTPIPHPEIPEDIVAGLWDSFQNMDAMVRAMPWWIIRTRMLITRHASFWANIQLLRNTSKYFPSESQVNMLLREAEAARAKT